MTLEHEFDVLTEVCIWCGFDRCDELTHDLLRYCPVPIEKRKTHMIVMEIPEFSSAINRS